MVSVLRPQVTGQSPASDSRPTQYRLIFWLSFWLVVVLVICKAVLLGLPKAASLDELTDYARNLGIMSHADVLFACAVGVAGFGVIAVVRRPKFQRAILVALVVLSVINVVYGIVSVQTFAYLRTPLTYPLLYLAGDMKNMRSSLGAFVTPVMLGALVFGPLIYLALVRASHRWIRPKPTRWFRVGQAAGLIVLLAYVAAGRWGYSTLPWADRVDRRVADNAHWVLLSSFVSEMSDRGMVQLAEDFPPEFLDDFWTVAERMPDGETALPSGQTSAPLWVNKRPEAPRTQFKSTPDPSFMSLLPIAEAEKMYSELHARPTSLSRPPRNVIVYVLESVGSHYLNLYGSPYDTTPRLNAEAKNSLVFDNVYAHCGVTANSLVAINLGIYPGLTWREYTVEQPNLPGTTLAELLKQRGYRTAYLTSGEIEYVNMDGFLSGRGYDMVGGYEKLACKELIISWGVEDRCLVDGVLSWIDQDRGVPRPFFMMAWTQQTHHPYEPSPNRPFIDFFKGLTKDKLPPDDYDLGRYLNTIHEADRQLGRLFDGLRQRGIADDTLVIVTGDHGEGFGLPHDIYGHGGRLYEEIVRVPFVVWNPRLYNPGRRVETLGGHIDLNPTLAELLEVPAAGPWQGRSLLQSNRPPRAYFYAANDDYLLGVREHNWKYIYNATIARELLFDLASDPTEQQNVAADDPDRCQELRKRIAAWMKYEERHIAKLRGASNQ